MISCNQSSATGIQPTLKPWLKSDQSYMDNYWFGPDILGCDVYHLIHKPE